MTEDAYPPERKALYAALAKAQGEFPPIPREKTVNTGTYSFSYAPLETIIDAIRPVLAKHGLAVIQPLESRQGNEPAIRTKILHVDGGAIEASFPLGETPGTIQQFGSKLTYLRRYALCSMLCLAAEDDDDGRKAESDYWPEPAGTRRNPHEPIDSYSDQRETKPLSEPQATKLNVLVGTLREQGHISTEQVYVAVSRIRNTNLLDLVNQVGGRDEEGELHWRQLRDDLTRSEASELIDRLETMQDRIGAVVPVGEFPEQY